MGGREGEGERKREEGREGEGERVSLHYCTHAIDLGPL